MCHQCIIHSATVFVPVTEYVKGKPATFECAFFTRIPDPEDECLEHTRLSRRIERMIASTLGAQASQLTRSRYSEVPVIRLTCGPLYQPCSLLHTAQRIRTEVRRIFGGIDVAVIDANHSVC